MSIINLPYFRRREYEMEIKIQIKGRVFSICFGHKTKWFGQVWKVCIVEEFYHNYEVTYAKVLRTW
jgi:hypothetical protein